MIPFVDDFLSGQQDCKEGRPHQAGKSEAYDRGYAAQYSLEQIECELTGNYTKFEQVTK